MQAIQRISAHLKQKVEWDDRGQYTGEEFKHREDRIQHPVGQPFGVIFLLAGFDGFHWNVSWVDDADQVAEQLSASTEHQIQGQKAGKSCCVNGKWNSLD